MSDGLLKRRIDLALRSRKLAVWLFGERGLPLIDYIRQLTPKAAVLQRRQEDEDENADEESPHTIGAAIEGSEAASA